MRSYTRCPVIIVFVTALALAGVGVGCSSAGKPPPPAPKPASSANLQQIRDAYARAYPESRVGVVIAALPEESLVAVGEVRGAEFRENQIVTFLDSDQRVLTTGVIVRLLDDSVHVRYEKPERGGRAPLVGDVMVRTPVGTGTL